MKKPSPALLAPLLLAIGCSTAVDSGEDEKRMESPVQPVLTARLRPAADTSPSAVRFELSNPGVDAIQVLRWHTPFATPIDHDLFSVSHADDDIVLPYLGPMIKRGEPTSADFMQLPGGETLEVTVELSQLYAMEKSGVWRVRYRPLDISGETWLNQQIRVDVGDGEVTLTLP